MLTACLRRATARIAAAWILLSPVLPLAFAADSFATPGAALAPRGSDVVFSPRFLRQDAPSVARAWGATRVEWVYVRNPASVAVLERMPRGVGHTLNANPALPRGAGYAMDFDSQPLVAPWMKSWDAKWVTTTHPETRQALFEQLGRFIDMGARSVQIDDPLLQYYSATTQGGDFNPATLMGFRDWLRRRADPAAVRAAGLADFDGDYHDFLKQRHRVRDAADYRRRFRNFPSTPLWLSYIRSTVVDYVVAVRDRLHAVRPDPVALSMNLTGLVWPDSSQPSYFLAPYADYVMSETPVVDADDLIARAATARALRVGFVPSLRPVDLQRNRVAIATLYALGAQPVVPWDVYVPDAPRYFGSIEQYGDLYGFVRQHPELFDDRTTMPSVGIVVDPRQFPAEAVKALSRRLSERQIPYDFVLVGPEVHGRARPDLIELRKMRLLVLTMADAQLSTAERSMLTDTKLPRLPLNSVPTETLDALRPVLVAPDGGNVRVYIRPRAGAEGDRALHIVDGVAGQPGVLDRGCKRRIGVRGVAADSRLPIAATWITQSGHDKLTGESSDGDVFFTLPNCPLWGVLLLEKSN